MTIMKKIFTQIICGAIVSLFALQTTFAAVDGHVVKGCVKDASDNPIPGVVVSLDSVTGVLTDIDGNYQITIPSGKKDPQLTFSMLSMKTQVISVSGRSRIDVVLEEDAEQLEEAVAIGYGSIRKSDLTGAVTAVRMDQDETFRSTSIDQMLRGNAAGVETVVSSEAPDAGVSIRIRGITSLNGSSEPLYVVDGVIMASNTIENGIDEAEEVNGLMGLNPNDIADIQILKDASATAIYGAAGANGVVLITTKQANNDKPKISFNTGFDLCTPYRKIDVLGFNEYVSYLQLRSDVGNVASTSLLNSIYDNYGTAEQMLNGEIKNWQNTYLGNSLRQRYYLSASGNPGKTWYSASVGYNNTDGIVANTGSEQITARLNLSVRLTKKLKLSSKINFAYIRSRMMQGAGSKEQGVSSSFIKSLVVYRPWVSIIETDDEKYEDESEMSISSPTKWVNDSYQTRSETRVTPNISLTYQIAPWINFVSAAGIDYHMQEIAKYKGPTVSKSPAAGSVQYAQFYNWNWDNTINVKKKFAKKHNIDAMAGFSMNRSSNNTSYVYSDDIFQYGIGTDNLDSSPSAKFTYSEVNESKMSFFARAIYNYADRYVLTATYRLDGSSRFAPKNRFSSFPSLAGAWRVSKERWFKAPVISMLKFRAGWGLVGNCSVRPYQYMSTYGHSYEGNHFNDAGYITTLGPNVLTNEDLKWETTGQWNVGLDYGMWDGRLTLVVDAYYKNTYDLLQSRIISYNSGFSNMYVNQGSIQNKGLEITLQAVPVSVRYFEWSFSGNISFNRNRLTDLGYEGSTHEFYFVPGQKTEQRYYTGANIGYGGYHSQQPVNIYMLGQPIGLFYGYKTDGLVQEGEYGIPYSKGNYEAGIYPTPGSIKYVDMNGDGYIDANDRTVIGDANPDFTYGFSTDFVYRKWKISASFQGSYGNQIINANRVQYTDTHKLTSPQNVLRSSVEKAWTVVNPTNYYVGIADPTRYYGTLFENVWHSSEKNYVTDRDVEDASYLRMSSLSLSYTLDLPKKSYLKRAVFGINVGNLFILTKYSGYSPIVNSYRVSSKRIGVDSGGYPANRTYGFDIKLSF